MRDQRRLADEHPRPRVVYRAQDGCPDQRLVPLDPGHRAGWKHRRQQRQFAGGELQRQQRDSAGADRTSAGAGAGVPDRQPSGAGAHVPRCVSIHSTSALGKNLRFGRTRTNVAIDLYNLFNSNTGTVYNQTYDPVTDRLDVAGADHGAERAVCAIQCDLRLLIKHHPTAASVPRRSRCNRPRASPSSVRSP